MNADERTVKKIFKVIEEITNLEQKKYIPWDARVLTAYKTFRALDKQRFKLEPADLDECLSDLLDARQALDDIIADSTEQKVEAKRSHRKEPQDKEKRMQVLYGLAWSQQSDYEYYHGATHFFDRLRNSNIDTSFIKGAKCLDLGTGHARYALAFIQLGAKSVTGIDFSKEVLAEGKRRLAKYPAEGRKIKLIYKSVYDLPKSMNGKFDFVCANGFIHHLPDPVEALKVTYRTMRRGGHGFTFVFSEDGTPRWRAIDAMRTLLAPVPMWYTHKTLEGYEAPGNKRFNFLDYSYTPIQKRFKRRTFEKILRDIGFKFEFLNGGVLHDSVLRSNLFDTDKLLFGYSEIRYLLKK